MDFAFSADQESFAARVRQFARERVAPRAADIDATGEFPRDLVREAAALGLAGVTVPQAHSGAGRMTCARMVGMTRCAGTIRSGYTSARVH